jgi:hypothetical protein
MLSQTLFVAAALAAFSPRPDALAKNTPQIEPEIGDISGYYTCKGMEAGGKAYSGVAAITRRGDVYVVQWMVGSGSTFSGIGIRQGNSFSASWAIPSDKGLVRGVNVYRVETTSIGPRLQGRWASMPGPGALQNETLTFLRPMEDEEE